MRIAILGATSQIAKDLILSFTVQREHELVLFARRPTAVQQWLAGLDLDGRHSICDFEAFGHTTHFDAILNFVGVGDPARAVAMGASIFDVTLTYDQLALNYLQQHPQCRYIFLSSGAAYGSGFDKPADRDTRAVIALNDLHPQDWYGIAKLHAECRHRSLSHLPIVDVRVFSYISHTQDIKARFLITDILRAIRDRTLLITSYENIVRDYIHPLDFYSMVCALLKAPVCNDVVDTYSRAPVGKMELLGVMQEKFGLYYEVAETPVAIDATGSKRNYFSRNTHASGFGYVPSLTSLEGILKESAEMLKRHPGIQ